MASTAASHLHLHRPALTRATLRVGWPRAVAAGLMVLLGGSFVVVTLMANLFHVGPAFDRLTEGFRPIMTAQAIQTDRQDIAGLSAAGTEIQTKLLPALSQQLNFTPGQMAGMLNVQFPDVAAGLNAIPKITPTFSGLVTTLDQQRPLFRSADAIPTKSLPAATVPWALLAVGVIIIGCGVFVFYTPRATTLIATTLGVVLIAGPLALGMVNKASNADQLNKNLKPVYTQQLVTQAGDSVKTLSAMGKQMQTKMLPVLAAQLKMQPAQLQTFLDQNFPATAAALEGLPAALGRFQVLVGTFDKHLSDYNTMKPVSFVPIVWLMIGGGIALLLLGGAGMLITRKHPDVLA